jgi:hypothetical protein
MLPRQIVFPNGCTIRLHVRPDPVKVAYEEVFELVPELITSTPKSIISSTCVYTKVH